MKFRDRLEWIFRIALLAFILASVAFLSALTAMRLAIQGREVVMPNVVGRRIHRPPRRIPMPRATIVEKSAIITTPRIRGARSRTEIDQPDERLRRRPPLPSPHAPTTEL